MRRTLVLLLAAPLLALACGGSSPSPLALVTSTAEKTTDAGTARLTMTMVMSGLPNRAEPMKLSTSGVIDFDEQLTRLTMDLDQLGLPVGGEIEMISDGTTVYMRAPYFAAAGFSTQWVSIDIRRSAQATTGLDIGQLPQTNQDPTQVLASLEGASDEIEKLGEDEVRGEDATHYRATVDLRRAVERSGAVTDRQRFEAFVDQLGSEQLTVDVWIDDDGRARRTSWEQSLPGQGDISITMDLFDFGSDLEVQPPPAGEVTDITDLAANAPARPR